MAFFDYIFIPKLYKEYGEGKFYEAGALEKWGEKIISTLSMFWNISYYTSPFILTFLYRRGYFVVESISTLAKFSTGIGILIAVSYCMRGLGRSQTQAFKKFARIYTQGGKYDSKNAAARQQLRLFDFDFKLWPVDFDVNSIEETTKKNIKMNMATKRVAKSFWVSASLPSELVAYVAVHTFGLRMIYPGSLKIIQSYLEPMLLQGRTKLIEEEKGIRNKIKTIDNNEIDTVFIDNRHNATNGRTLVVCSEGNAGFYEIGIMTTPLELKYSVLGWNHPGFAGSTGQPFPEQDENGIDAVMQFAFHKLGFSPENIIMFGWSIGAYSSLYIASRYPEIKGIILDATFDDILPLALPRMPESLSSIVKLAIRNYVNLNNSELINKYDGPILMIRRTEDEIICIDEMNMTTNRGNYLLTNMLKYRFPNIFKESQVSHILKLLSNPLDTWGNSTETDELCYSLLMSYLSENDKIYPLSIGSDYVEAQKNQMAEFLVRKHFLDFKSSHCTPLPTEYFQTPWDLLNETDYVFT